MSGNTASQMNGELVKSERKKCETEILSIHTDHSTVTAATVTLVIFGVVSLSSV